MDFRRISLKLLDFKIKFSAFPGKLSCHLQKEKLIGIGLFSSKLESKATFEHLKITY